MRMSQLIAAGLLALAWPLAGGAQDLSPERFVRADVEARELTLEGLAERIDQEIAGVSSEAQIETAEANRQRIEAVFERYGTSGARHASYGTRNADAIAAWLERHPEWQGRYDELGASFEALSEQADALRGGS